MFETVPQGGDAQAHLEFAREALLEFGQRQVGLPMDPATQGLVVLFQAGAPVAATLPGLDAAGVRLKFAVTLHAALGEFEEPGDLRRAVPALPGRDDTLTQISAVGSHFRTLPHPATN